MARTAVAEAQLEQEHQARERQRAVVYAVNFVVAGVVLAIGFAPWYLWPEWKTWTEWPWYPQYVTPLSVAAALAAILALRIALQWDRAVVLRLGRFHSLRGPGMFFMVPIVDRIARLVDMRIRAASFQAESTLTKDTVPVNVDAICFWLVWDAKKAVLEVESFYRAIVLSAQTALRDCIGRHTLAEMLTEREALGKALQEVLDAKTTAWGITVQSVEIRDVIIPQALEDAMSKQAQAERERQARIILGTAETEIAGKFVEAAAPYQNNPVAVHLRAMNMLYEGLREKGSIIVVPSTAVESMNLGAIGGLTGLASSQSLSDGTGPAKASGG
jgi:regulator of protease activity HflC (stomatin/prohibitin superfamily)